MSFQILAIVLMFGSTARGEQTEQSNRLFAELDGLGFVVHLFDDGEGF